MSITFQYGPVGGAVDLAYRSGQGIRKRQNAQDDLGFLSQVNQAQANEDRAYANEIQSALSNRQLDLRAGEATMENQRRSEAAQMESQSRNAQFSAGLADRAADRDSRERIASTQGQASVTRQQPRQPDPAGRAYIESLPDSSQKTQALALFDATGEISSAVKPQRPQMSRERDDSSALRAEYSRLASSLSRVEKQLAETSFDATATFDNQINGINESGSVRGARAGMEARYQDAFRTQAATRDRLAQLEAALGQRTDAMLDEPAVDSQVVNQIIQSRQAPQQGQQSGQDVPTIDSAQEYAELPPGSQYIDAADGQVYTKR